MNLRFEPSAESSNGVQRYFPAVPVGVEAASALPVLQSKISPFEFRSFADHDLDSVNPSMRPLANRVGKDDRIDGHIDPELVVWRDSVDGGVTHAEAVKAARQEGFHEGQLEGGREGRAAMEAETQLLIMRNREQLVASVRQFGQAQEKYFAEVEQQVVKLALAIAARVLHRETALDPLLLTGVVRVALEKMADRSGVVLRVASADVAGWEQVFRSLQPSERPRVAEDPGLGRGECVLDTTMGTVELGVSVQLEEIEKGFFDLLNHRPVR